MSTSGDARTRPGQGRARSAARLGLAGLMTAAGVGHFVATDAFLGQVPPWLPARTWIVWGSGVAELGFAAALVGLGRHRRQVGWALAAFFVAVLPGNVHQAVAGNDAFGLSTPAARWGRLLAQPALVALALWSTGAVGGAGRATPQAGSDAGGGART